MNSNSSFELKNKFYNYLDKALEKTRNHPEYNINKNNHHLNSEETKQGLVVLDFMSKLNDLLGDLNKIEVFIKRFPSKKFYEENDIDQLEYIKYHYEVFIHKIHTILEVKKLTVNKFYEIGLNEKDCNWINLKKHKKIRDSLVSEIIESYFKTFEHIIKHRHLNTHRAYFGDKTNDELKIESMIHRNAEKYGLNVGEELRRMIPKGYVEYKIKEYRKERLEYIRSGIKAADTYVKQFENIILAEFLIKIKN